LGNFLKISILRLSWVDDDRIVLFNGKIATKTAISITTRKEISMV